MPAVGEIDVSSRRRARRGNVIRPALASVLALGLGGAATAGRADAQTSSGAPEVTTTVGPVKVDNITSRTASAKAVVSANMKNRVVLAFRNPNGTSKVDKDYYSKHPKKCRIFTPDQYDNSGSVLGKSPNRPRFFDDNRTIIGCKDSKSPTGWVKVGVPKNRRVLKDGFQPSKDIIPGTDCNNIILPTIRKPYKPPKIIPIVVRSFNEEVNFDLSAKVSAKAQCSADTWATSSAEARVHTHMKIAAILRGRLRSAKEEFIAEQKAKIELDAKASCSEGSGSGGNHAPVISIVNPQHVLVNGVQKICAYAQDPDGANDIKSVIWSKTGNVNFTTGDYPGDESGEHCVGIVAGTYADTATITAIAVDKLGATGTDSALLPVVLDTKGQPGGF